MTLVTPGDAAVTQEPPRPRHAARGRAGSYPVVAGRPGGPDGAGDDGDASAPAPYACGVRASQLVAEAEAEEASEM